MARTTHEEETIIVKVAKTGDTVKEVCLNGDRTVEDALEAAGLEYDETSRLRVNGQTVDLDDELEDGEILTVGRKIKGGA
jgi:sulfur carrier protein ThiS